MVPIGLIIEDNPDYIEIYRRMLRRFGVESECAASASGARELIARLSDAAIVLLDLQLAEGDGLALLAEIESSPLAGKTILITSFPMIGRAFSLSIPVIDKLSMEGLREELTRILGPLADAHGGQAPEEPS